MRLVFLGTPAFAVPTLERMVAAGHETVAVFTQPDRAKGRGRKESAPPVKEAAQRLGIPVFQPNRIREPQAVEHLRTMEPQAMVVVGYGQILPQAILDIPPFGIINVHASLLPKYRGAAPVQWAIASGETRTGVTTMRIDAGLDTGDILLQWDTEIGETETAVELGGRLAVAGADLLVRTLAELETIRPQPQDETLASYAPILTREDGHIDWKLSPREIVNRIRGFVPWPGCYGSLRGQRFQIWKARLANVEFPPGALRAVDRRLFAGSIELLEVQLEGKNRMAASAFLNGFPLEGNEVLE